MKFTVFGATGAIGQLLVKKALEEGILVRAYARNPEKITFTHQNMDIFYGELNDIENIQLAVSGSDAVISTLGPPLVRRYEGTPILDGYKNIISVMKFEKISRLIILATPSVKSADDTVSTATVLPGIAARILFPNAYSEITGIGREVVSSGLDWTIVRIIAPNNTPAVGKIPVTFGGKKIHWSISRSDIADFMLNLAKNEKYIHSMPIIGS